MKLEEIMKKYTYISILILAYFLASAQNVVNQGTIPEIEKAIQKLKSDTMMKNASWGVCVIRLKDGKTIAAFDADRCLIPASAIKIGATYPAWCILGKDFRFKTVFETDGHRDDKVMMGNVYIKGSGDPTLGSYRFPGTDIDSIFERFASVLKDAGYTSVNGSVIGDATAYTDEGIPGSWIWSDIGNYYGTGCYGLNIYENSYKAVFRPGLKPGDSARLIEIDPPISGMDLDNRVRTGTIGSGDKVILYGGPYMYYRRMEGTVPAGVSSFIVKGSLPEPDLLAAQLLCKNIIIKDMSFASDPTTVRRLARNGNFINTKRTMLMEHFSPELISIIRVTHEKSVNLYAEALVRAISLKSGNNGSITGGLEIIREFWIKKGLDMTGAQMTDGSGLSPLDRISCRQLAGMMKIISLEDSKHEFLNTLNLAGETGNLKNLFKDSPAASNLRAKSGYMTGVRSYTGIVKDLHGDELVFAVIVNGYNGSAAAMKEKLEKLLIAVSKYSE